MFNEKSQDFFEKSLDFILKSPDIFKKSPDFFYTPSKPVGKFSFGSAKNFLFPASKRLVYPG